ncbi:hypothetical protein AWQ21_04540 [Picosynechococcus sp. PCC 7003]|uniref:type II toxin-antitoxin system RelB/DinJ family antitoxin n=1 Tax=Picosynechococcus sp. PCC 7003 TaxID=374981 RepID=UPI00081072A0|nr:type II toxin-antitoxin system RelB/DinJ family antitoxin [Picosynechococcus sp. PCC 7003]ANV83713.1 hypothetical protein AWQ21_04540 [Picosynechococcus sp. PCC 7003]
MKFEDLKKRLDKDRPMTTITLRMPEEAIALFYEQIAKHHGLPFQIDDYSEETLATFAATDRGEDLVVCEDAEDMFSKLKL